MTVLYPSFLWLFIPLMILFWTHRKRDLITTVHLIVLMLIVTALSRPVLQEGLQERSLDAKNIIIALDVSYSMRAKDIEPTRYDFAKETIQALLKENAKDNIMLIAFTTNPLLLSPPTTDHELINIALKSLNPEYILTKGTSLKKLFKKIVSMQRSKTLHQNLILITDGGEEDNVESLTEELEKVNISLTVLALGTKQGTTIEKPDGTLLKDDKNNLVVSRINPLLKKLTSQVDGLYLTASSSSETTAKDLQKALSTEGQKAEKITKMQYNYTELYQIFVFLAALLFLMVHTRASKYLITLFILLGVNLEASMLDNYHLNQAYKSYKLEDFNNSKSRLKKIDEPSLQSQFALGNTYYKLHSYKKALKVYMSIHSRSEKTKQRLYYNIANSYAMLEEYDKAKIYYTKALQLGKDEDSRHNLQLVALLKKKKDAEFGIAHPKSQSSDSSKSESSESDKEEARDEDQPSSGSGSGGENKTDEKANKKEEKKQLILDENQEQQPLSSKVYELINKGYIRETQPW
ncbi:MAG: VWA domain-containing protein [Sulfurovum sp.]|nr:VWA domain-containing protein [Sulfurovum sp.]